MSFKSIFKVYMFTIALFGATILTQKQNETISGKCLKQSLLRLVDSGCNFNPDPKVLELLKTYSNPTQNFNFGKATYEQAAALWPTPHFLAGYFKTAIDNPFVAIRGEIGAGIRYYGDFVTISMSNIHLCSDQGDYADYSMTDAQIVIRRSLVSNYSKDDLRIAGWQLACESKLSTYKELLKDTDFTNPVIAQE